MTRIRTLLIVGVALLSFGAGALHGGAFAAPTPSTSYLPVVARTGSPPPTALIYSCQCGAVSATLRPDGTVLLTILDHSRGGLIVVGIDDGATFRELPTPMQSLAASDAPAPAFQFPGDKQGIGDTVEAFGRLVTYAPNRIEDGGSYNIWRFVYAAPK